MTVPVYCTTDDLKYELGSYEMTDDGRDDSKWDLAISAASRQIDNWCGQRFYMDDTAVARTFTTTGRRELFLPLGIASTDDLVIAVDTNDSATFGGTIGDTDYALHPSNALADGKPITKIVLTGVSYPSSLSYYGRDLVQITAKWGWPAVPDEIKKATMIQAADLFKAKDAVFGVAGTNDFGAVRVRSGLNTFAESLVMPYVVVQGSAA